MQKMAASKMFSHPTAFRNTKASPSLPYFPFTPPAIVGGLRTPPLTRFVVNNPTTATTSNNQDMGALQPRPFEARLLPKSTASDTIATPRSTDVAAPRPSTTRIRIRIPPKPVLDATGDDLTSLDGVEPPTKTAPVGDYEDRDKKPAAVTGKKTSNASNVATLDNECSVDTDDETVRTSNTVSPETTEEQKGNKSDEESIIVIIKHNKALYTIDNVAKSVDTGVSNVPFKKRAAAGLKTTGLAAAYKTKTKPDKKKKGRESVNTTQDVGEVIDADKSDTTPPAETTKVIVLDDDSTTAVESQFGGNSSSSSKMAGPTMLSPRTRGERYWNGLQQLKMMETLRCGQQAAFPPSMAVAPGRIASRQSGYSPLVSQAAMPVPPQIPIEYFTPFEEAQLVHIARFVKAEGNAYDWNKILTAFNEVTGTSHRSIQTLQLKFDMLMQQQEQLMTPAALHPLDPRRFAAATSGSGMMPPPIKRVMTMADLDHQGTSFEPVAKKRKTKATSASPRPATTTPALARPQDTMAELARRMDQLEAQMPAWNEKLNVLHATQDNAFVDVQTGLKSLQDRQIVLEKQMHHTVIQMDFLKYSLLTMWDYVGTTLFSAASTSSSLSSSMQE
jgi:hypothetical protein